MGIIKMLSFTPTEVLKVNLLHKITKAKKRYTIVTVYYEVKNSKKKYIIKEIFTVDGPYSGNGEDLPSVTKNNREVITEKEIENG